MDSRGTRSTDVYSTPISDVFPQNARLNICRPSARESAAADMDNLVSPRKQLYPRRSRLTAVALAIVACAVVALVAVRRGEQPSTALATETGDTIFEHAGDDGDGSPSLGDAAIAFGDKKSLLVEDHREIKALKSEVKTLEGEVDTLYSKLNKRGKGHIEVNVAVGAPGRPGDIGPMGPVRTSLPLCDGLHPLCVVTRRCRWDRGVSQGSYACACVALASFDIPFQHSRHCWTPWLHWRKRCILPRPCTRLATHHRGSLTTALQSGNDGKPGAAGPKGDKGDQGIEGVPGPRGQRGVCLLPPVPLTFLFQINVNRGSRSHGSKRQQWPPRLRRHPRTYRTHCSAPRTSLLSLV
jgi:hypothetical protein